MIEIRVSDLRQYSYCPRIVFYNYVMPIERITSYKMEHGRTSEDWLGRLEKRRTLRKYKLDGAARRFHVPLRSHALGLSGNVDLVLESSDAAHPLDFKETRGVVQQSHKLQLCAYGLLIEEEFKKPSPFGFIYLIPPGRVVRIDFDAALKRATLDTVEAIRKCITEELLPEPTPVRPRCRDCEFQNFCGDIF